MILLHPFVIGELALGHLCLRRIVLKALLDLPQATVATDEEALHFIDSNGLFGRGIGYVDAHLLAAIRLTPGSSLWTNDKRLQAVAADLGLAVSAAVR
jgi:predicted nucleic acid-binding protein